MTDEREWREKYAQAVKRIADSEARALELQNVMRLLIGRLCLAAQGRHARLDGELSRVAGAVRSNAGAEELRELLAPLSQAVAVLDSEAPPKSATPAVQKPVPSSSPAARDEPPAPGAPVTPTAAAEASVPPPQGAPAAPVLDRLALFPELRDVLRGLRERGVDTLTAPELGGLFERLAVFATEQRAKVEREKLELQNLLQAMAARLDEITSHLSGELAERNASNDDTQTLNQLVTGEVQQLRNEFERAGDLAQLRDQLFARLDRILNHLHDFRQREDIRVRTYRDRVQRMRVRISALERESRTLQETLREEQRLAMIDALTGIPNRAAYDDRIEEEYKRWKRFGRPVSVLAWDIDRFKAINDAYGHKAGDKVLRVIGQHLASHVRDTDFVARYGGEEFVMLLVGTPPEEARVVADKIRLEIAGLGFHFHEQPVKVTASCGITAFADGDTPDAAFDRADRALYRAKQAGRNCCVIG